MTAWRLATSLVPAVRLSGRQTSCVPVLSAGTFVRTNTTACHWSPPPIHLVWIGTAHLLTEESAAAAQDSPFTIWSLPAHVAPSPWCCHNGNEMNCKLPTPLSEGCMWSVASQLQWWWMMQFLSIGFTNHSRAEGNYVCRWKTQIYVVFSTVWGVYSFFLALQGNTGNHWVSAGKVWY